MDLFSSISPFRESRIPRHLPPEKMVPNQEVVKEFLARKEDDEIVLEGKTMDRYPTKWIFSKIGPDPLRWRSKETKGRGKDLDAYRKAEDESCLADYAQSGLVQSSRIPHR